MRKLTKIVTAAAAGVGLAVSMSLPAFATTHYGPAGYVTVWDGCPVGHCGAAWPIPVGTISTCYSVPSGSNDRISAVDNYTSHQIRFYKDGGCGVPYWDFYADTANYALSSGQGNNSYSSYRFF